MFGSHASLFVIPNISSYHKIRKFNFIIDKGIFREAMNIMILMLGGNSEIGTHEWSDLNYLIYPRHLFRSRAVANLISLSKKNTFLQTYEHVLSYHII